MGICILSAAFQFLFGALACIKAVKLFILQKNIGDMPTTPIGQLAIGQDAKIKGVADAEEPIKPARSVTPCVYYDYQLMEISGGKKRRWVPFEREDGYIQFTLTDESGSGWIEAESAEIDAP